MATTPTDLVKDYLTARVSVPQTPYTQEQSERYSAEAEDGNNDEYSRKRRKEEEEEPVPTKEEFEKNYQEAEREIEYNSQRELDDLDESASDYDEDGLEADEFSGNYFSQPDESEQKESLGDLIRAKYDSFSEKISNSAGSAAGAFVSGFNKKMDSFERGDPLFATKRPAKGKTIRYVSRPTRQNRNLSRPYVGGRFDNSFSLGTNAGYNPYYPVNDGRQSASPRSTMDVYLPSGGAAYEGEFSGRNAFKQSEFSDERKRYDPFGFGVDGRLSADGFNNMSGEFGDSLLGGVGNRKESSIFGGMSAGTDTVFGDGAMFNANRAKGKKEMSGFALDLIIGDSGGMYNTTDPSPRKPKTKRKSTSTRKTATKKATKKPSTKRKSASTRKRSSTGFTLP